LVAHLVRLAQQQQGEHPQQDARRTGPRSAAQVAVAAEVVEEPGHPLLARRRWEQTSKDEAAYPAAGSEALAAPQVQASQQEPRQQQGPAP
jgi:hypothetical protein